MNESERILRIAEAGLKASKDFIRSAGREWQKIDIDRDNIGEIGELSQAGLIRLRILINDSTVIEGSGSGWIDESRQRYGDAAAYLPKEWQLTLDGEAFQDFLKETPIHTRLDCIGFLTTRKRATIIDLSGIVNYATQPGSNEDKKVAKAWKYANENPKASMPDIVKRFGLSSESSFRRKAGDNLNPRGRGRKRLD